MMTEMRAGRWKMQNSNTGSKNLVTRIPERNTTADAASIAIDAIRQDSDSEGAPVDMGIPRVCAVG